MAYKPTDMRLLLPNTADKPDHLMLHPLVVFSPVVRKVSHFTPCGSLIHAFSLFA